MNKNAAYVRVAVRVRPPEDNNNYKTLISSTSTLNGDVLLVRDPLQGGPAREYLFDKFFDANDTQDNVFEEVGRPMCDHFLAGFNATCLAYGQTGAGKTYTMFGVDDGPRGIAYDMIEYIYKNIEAENSTGNTKFTVSMYLFEMYIDQLRDFNIVLDAPPQARQAQQTQNQDTTGPGLGVMSLASIKAGAGKRHPLYSLRQFKPSTCYEAKDRLYQSLLMRFTASTQMNERSSRSHFLMVIGLNQHMSNNLTTSSLLSVVDLAGSERLSKSGSTGVRQNEAIFINKSLSALTHVITSLSLRAPHVPYRDSALTRLLSDSFGGSSFTTVLVMIHPSKANIFETLSSISFGARCKGIINDVRITVGRTALIDETANIYEGKEDYNNGLGKTGLENSKLTRTFSKKSIIENDINRTGIEDNSMGGVKSGYEKQMGILIGEISKIKQQILEEKKKLEKGIGLSDYEGDDDIYGLGNEENPEGYLSLPKRGNAKMVQEAKKARLNELKKLLETELETTGYLLQKLQQREDDYQEVTKRTTNDIAMYRISTEEMKLKTLELEYEKSSAIKIISEAAEEAEKRHKQEKEIIEENNKVILEHNIEPLFKPITIETSRQNSLHLGSKSCNNDFYPRQDSILSPLSTFSNSSRATTSRSSVIRRPNNVINTQSRNTTSGNVSEISTRRSYSNNKFNIDRGRKCLTERKPIISNADSLISNTTFNTYRDNKPSSVSLYTLTPKQRKLRSITATKQGNLIPWERMSYIEPKINTCWTERLQLSENAKINNPDFARMEKLKSIETHDYSYKPETIKDIDVNQNEIKTFRESKDAVLNGLRKDIYENKTAILFLSIVCNKSDIPKNIQNTIFKIRRERRMKKLDYDPLPPPTVYKKVNGK